MDGGGDEYSARVQRLAVLHHGEPFSNGNHVLDGGVSRFDRDVDSAPSRDCADPADMFHPGHEESAGGGESRSKISLHNQVVHQGRERAREDR